MPPSGTSSLRPHAGIAPLPDMCGRSGEGWHSAAQRRQLPAAGNAWHLQTVDNARPLCPVVKAAAPVWPASSTDQQCDWKMPILEEEPQRFPEQLLDELAAAPGNRSWWVLYTKARQEKSLARELLQWQVPFYLPQIRKARRVRGRRIESFLPLFSGYLFLLGDESERLQSLKTNRVSRVLPVRDADRLVFDLRQLSHLIASNAPLTVESRLQPGDRVRVRAGVLAGLEGVVLHRRGGTRLLIVVDFLQQGASVEIDDDLLEPIG